MIICLGPICVPLPYVLPFLLWLCAKAWAWFRSRVLGQEVAVAAQGTSAPPTADLPKRLQDGVVGVEDDEAWAELVGRGPVLVQFTAPWCKPCKAVAPVFDALATRSDTVTFARVDITALPDLASSLGVSAIPAFHHYAAGALVDSLVGGSTQQTTDFVDNALA